MPILIKGFEMLKKKQFRKSKNFLYVQNVNMKTVFTSTINIKVNKDINSREILYENYGNWFIICAKSSKSCPDNFYYRRENSNNIYLTAILKLLYCILKTEMMEINILSLTYVLFEDLAFLQNSESP